MATSRIVLRNYLLCVSAMQADTEPCAQNKYCDHAVTICDYGLTQKGDYLYGTNREQNHRLQFHLQRTVCKALYLNQSR